MKFFLDLSHSSNLRFPWESARTGVDVTPDCCPEVRLYQMHITGDIAFAARQYIAATGDQNWLTSEMGDDLIYETAKFWASRAIYNPMREQYEILSKIISFLIITNITCEIFFLQWYYHLMKMRNRSKITRSIPML